MKFSFRFIFFLITTSLLLSGCEKLEVDTDKRNEINIIGHGGVGFQSPRNQLPHNSMESIEKALEFYQADGVEVDVHVSQDHTLWMYHDETLNTMTDCEGCIFTSRDAEINNCRFRNDFMVNVANSSYKMRELKWFVDYIRNSENPPYLFIDTRTYTVCDSDSIPHEYMANALNNLLQGFEHKSRVYITSHDRSFIRKMKTILPDIQYLFEATYSEEMLDFILENELDGAILSNKETTAEMVEQLKSHDLIVTLFRIKVQDGVVSAANKSPDFIMVDNLPLAINTLR